MANGSKYYANGSRYCADIGLLAIDRSRYSCRHATAYCMAHCYNNKLYSCYSSMESKDQKNDVLWANLDGEGMRAICSKAVNGRMRLCTRGEPFASDGDIDRVREWLTANPDVLFGYRLEHGGTTISASASTAKLGHCRTRA